MGDTTFVCTVCLEDLAESDNRFLMKLIGNDVVCKSCVKDHIVSLFEKALIREFDYPLTWGRRVLQPLSFVDELEKGFLDRYKRREQEYLTPAKMRVYCQNKVLACNALPVGTSSPHWMGVAMNPWQLQAAELSGAEIVDCGAMVCQRKTEFTDQIMYLPTCWSCKGKAYPCCGAPCYPGGFSIHTGEDTHKEHICARNDADETSNFITPDMQRGIDYQICSAKLCGQVLQLKYGCNFIRCQCGQGTCFCCGAGPLKDTDKEHWKLGMPCPRFGKKNNQHAIFDHPQGGIGGARVA